MTPTYGNTLMGLACSKPVRRRGRLQDLTYYAPQPRAVIEVVAFCRFTIASFRTANRTRASDHAHQGKLSSLAFLRETKASASPRTNNILGSGRERP